MDLRHVARNGVFVSCVLLQSLGATLIVGSDGSGPLQLLVSDGTLQSTFGPNTGTAGAVDAAGGLFVAIPGDTASTINVYGPSQDLLNTFSFTANGDSRSDAAYVTDLSWGDAGTLWISTFTGRIYHLAPNGAVLSSFDTGNTAPGVAFDGSSLYTSSGAGFVAANPFIYRRNLAGNITNSIDTGLNDTLGVAYDRQAGTLWVGGFDVLSNVSLNGTILATLAIPGTHYGVEEGTLGAVSPSPIPEPATWVLFLTGAGLLALARIRIKPGAVALVVAGLVLPLAHAAVAVTALTPSLASPQPVGTLVAFTAAASDTDAGALRYRFRVRPAGGQWAMVRDYSPASSVTWSAIDNDGLYEIEVSAINRATSSNQALSILYMFSSRTTSGAPTVSQTNHPLVALYSAPACPAGSDVRVRFKLPPDLYWQSTQLKPCNGTTSVNFYVAGMRASSTYELRQDVISGPRVVSGPALNFTTGAIPVALPQTSAVRPLQPPSSMTEGVVLFEGNGQGFLPYAVDSSLHVIWYLTISQGYIARPIAGGDFGAVYGLTTDLPNSGLREYDVAGNLVKETNVERMNDQLLARGMNTITAFHHEVRRLPNGNYLALGMTERISSAQGPAQDILGDMILVLDNNLQLRWAWDSFDHLDVSRPPTLGETCTNTPGLCVLLKANTAVDWTHGNAVSVAPDGNIVYSARDQDFVYKIAYANGAGDGHLIWRLGKGGDFTYLSSDPYPWFSHQHEFEFEDATTATVFDNGNTRVQSLGGNSRGQALKIDEVNKTVTLLLNADLGAYSFALGSAQRLLNGNYAFGNGWMNHTDNSESSEWSPSAAGIANIHSNSVNYRSFRLRDLFSAP